MMWKLFTFYLTDKSFAIHYLNYSKKEMKIFVVTLFCLSYRATRNVLPELRMPRQSFVTSRAELGNWLGSLASHVSINNNQVKSCVNICIFLSLHCITSSDRGSLSVLAYTRHWAYICSLSQFLPGSAHRRRLSWQKELCVIFSSAGSSCHEILFQSCLF